MEVINQKKDHWGGRHNEKKCIGFQIREQDTSNRVSYCPFFRPVRGTFSLVCLFRWKFPELNGGFHRNITFAWSIFQHNMFILPDGKSWDNDGHRANRSFNKTLRRVRAPPLSELSFAASAAQCFSATGIRTPAGNRPGVQGFNAIPSGND